MLVPVAVLAVETVPLGLAAATVVFAACVAAKAAPPVTRLPATTIAASDRFIGILIFVFIVLSFPLIACLCSIRLSTSACRSFVHRLATSCGQRADRPPDDPARTLRPPLAQWGAARSRPDRLA